MEMNNHQNSFKADQSINFFDVGKRVARITALTGLALMSACKVDEADSVGMNGNNKSLPVGFDRSAGYVNFDSDDLPGYTTIDSQFPVLHFSGSNLDKSAIAYTSLAKLKMGAPLNRESVSRAEGLELTLDDLVPTGELVAEKNGEALTVSRPNEVATFAAWSPMDSNVIAYSYAHGDHYGLAVADISNGSSKVIAEGDFAPDFLAWSDDGQSIGLNVRDKSIAEDETSDGEFPEEVPMHWQNFDIENGKSIFDVESLHLGNGIRPSSLDESMDIEFPQGTLSISEVMGGEDATLDRIDEDGNKVSGTLRIDQLRNRSKNGIAYVNVDDDVMTLYATDGSGEPVPVSGSSSVTYYLPNQSGYTDTIVQVGQGYSSYCSASGSYSHTSGSTMKYAVDIQIPQGSSNDKVIASAAGSTYAFGSSATCNSADSSGCASYSSSCSAYSGWGNYVILSHSDGYYTKSTHLESTNFKVVTPACISTSKGCWLADEGYTGASSGSKYDINMGTSYKCGDHVHFQRQSGGGTSSSSISVSFSETGSLSSSSCKSYSPTTSAVTCSL